MTFNARVARVLIASPGDTREERDAVERSLHRWNSARAERAQVVLLPRRWETHTVPGIGASPQDVINEQLADEADIVIAIFDARLGAPTEAARSGTAEEIERAHQAEKPVHVYFSNEPIPHDVDIYQLKALRDYKDSLRSRGILGSYTTPEDLASQVASAIEHDLPTLKPDAAQLFCLSRSEATPFMKVDMQTASHLVFLGISNSTLSTYLHEAMVDAESQHRTLPWEDLQVYFAGQATGETWEGDAFSENRTNAILDIWDVLRGGVREGTLPALGRVTFRTNSSEGYFSGSLFRAPEDNDDAEFEYPVIYVVFNVPTTRADTKHSSTLRLTSKTRDLVIKKYHDTFSTAYEALSETSSLILRRSPREVWDSSAHAWFNFEKRSIYVNTMEYLADFAEIESGQHVLDLGCGTGQASAVLAKKVGPEGALTVLDSSPEMIRMAKRVLQGRDRNNVKFVVSDIQSEPGLATPKGGFDTAVAHFSLQCLACEGFTLKAFATVLNHSLKNSGEAVLAVHNTVLRDDGFQFRRWRDPLRVSLEQRARQHGYTLRPQGGGTPRFHEQDIKDAFEEAGFIFIARDVEDFPRTMLDRVLMWRVAAVLDSFLEVNRLSPHQITELLNEVKSDVEAKATKPTKVLFQRFRKSPGNTVQSAAEVTGDSGPRPTSP